MPFIVCDECGTKNELASRPQAEGGAGDSYVYCRSCANRIKTSASAESAAEGSGAGDLLDELLGLPLAQAHHPTRVAKPEPAPRAVSAADATAEPALDSAAEAQAELVPADATHEPPATVDVEPVRALAADAPLVATPAPEPTTHPTTLGGAPEISATAAIEPAPVAAAAPPTLVAPANSEVTPATAASSEVTPATAASSEVSPATSASSEVRAAAAEPAPAPAAATETSPAGIGRPAVPAGIGRPAVPAGIGRPAVPAGIGRPAVPAGIGRPAAPATAAKPNASAESAASAEPAASAQSAVASSSPVPARVEPAHAPARPFPPSAADVIAAPVVAIATSAPQREAKPAPSALEAALRSLEASTRAPLQPKASERLGELAPERAAMGVSATVAVERAEPTPTFAAVGRPAPAQQAATPPDAADELSWDLPSPVPPGASELAKALASNAAESSALVPRPKSESEQPVVEPASAESSLVEQRQPVRELPHVATAAGVANIRATLPFGPTLPSPDGLPGIVAALHFDRAQAPRAGDPPPAPEAQSGLASLSTSLQESPPSPALAAPEAVEATPAVLRRPFFEPSARTTSDAPTTQSWLPPEPVPSKLRRYAPLAAGAFAVLVAFVGGIQVGKMSPNSPAPSVAAAAQPTTVAPRPPVAEVAAPPTATAVPASAGTPAPAEPAAATAEEKISRTDLVALKAPGGFSAKAANAALGQATGRARACKKPGSVGGKALALVTFAPSGRVEDVTISGARFAGTPIATCIASALSSVRVQPFAGSSQTVKRAIKLD